MAVGDTVVRTCVECGNQFVHKVRSAGRHPDRCSVECKRLRAAARTTQYKQERYDPWRWENTILEWDE